MRKVEKMKLNGHKGKRENIKGEKAHSFIHSCLFAIYEKELSSKASLGRKPRRRRMVSMVRLSILNID